MGMFDSGRDQALDMLASAGWGNESDGDVDSPTGHFTRVSIAPRELPEILDGFAEEFADIGEDFTADELVGDYIVIRDSAGFLFVESYRTLDECQRVYTHKLDEFDVWINQDEGDI